MMVGVAGSGKTTFAKKLEKRGAIVVSSDAIRKEFWNDESNQQKPHKIFEECHRRISYLLKEGYWVVFDATNLSARRREEFLKNFVKSNAKKSVL